jgi:lipopolysaccharide transport system ATP-binding protein
LRDTLTDAFSASLRRFRSPSSSNGHAPTIWALKDVSFEVQRGEVIGVIGRNGAGKSTLLKVLSRITEPTEGSAQIHGRVGSLLEVGTGFHPELTARENIFLNGAILGMRKAEIRRKFDEMVAFAEVERFIDTPVKHYSSGMYVRLAFAVAAHLEPEILIVDEVLAVGDVAFQKKCLGRMGDAAKGGRTVLFVSHNMLALRGLCTRALCLESGRLVEDGAAGQVVSHYLQKAGGPQGSARGPQPAIGNQHVRIQSIRIIAGSREAHEQITLETSVALEFTYWNAVSDSLLNLSLEVYTLEDTCAFSVVSPPTRRPTGLIREVCRIPPNLLNDTVYEVRLQVVRDTSVTLLDVPKALSFEVAETDRQLNWYGKWQGALRPALEWSSEVLQSDHARPGKNEIPTMVE